MTKSRESNRLINEKSPYLLQHAYNPVNWFPWSKEAFETAKREDKPIFLSIGYSTCHWCHVMGRESFENLEVAKILNENFISIKVDKEERPDVDSIYMNVCQAFTGSGGWPLTIFITPDQKPFFAGTYFPPQARYGSIGLIDLLKETVKQWKQNKQELIKSGDEITRILNHTKNAKPANVSKELADKGFRQLQRSFDSQYGGFGNAPKFPTPHHLLFLMRYSVFSNDKEALDMVETTLTKMAQGGIFDQIGYGFSRYSTEKTWLVPHFEKMLYDNALLIMAYLECYKMTQNEFYRSIAVKTLQYVTNELLSHEGGFFSAQDADSEGEEGKYYVFTPHEIVDLLGEADGSLFNQYFDITLQGNFEGMNIPNLQKNKPYDPKIEGLALRVYEYRKNRMHLHKDDKILTSWNGMMIAAFSKASRILKEPSYLDTAKKAFAFIENELSEDGKLKVSYREGKTSGFGFLDDYAYVIWALLELYEATFEEEYLTKAQKYANHVIDSFYDYDNGGFYFSGNDSETLILRPKETYDGAIPSGNSVMAYTLLKLARLTKSVDIEDIAQKQVDFMASQANDYPIGHSFYLIALISAILPSKQVVCVLKEKEDTERFMDNYPSDIYFRVISDPTKEYPLINDKTTYYVCEGNQCLPPTNEWEAIAPLNFSP